jgi:hypothetical protein
MFNYKKNYTFLKEVFNKVKGNIKIKGKRRERQLSYKEYRDIISKYFDYLIEEVAINRNKVKLPNKFGSIYVKKCEQKRAFHIRVDVSKTIETGEVVRYKVPIMEDYYNKLVWNRPSKFRKCKILPLTKFKEVINTVKEY